MSTNIVERLKEFMDNEARSCSMDFGCVTPLYVYRMWGGQVPLNEIEEAMLVIKAHNNRKAFLGGSLENPSCEN